MTACAEPGCDRRAQVKGLCGRHYEADYRRRQANNGDPLTQAGVVSSQAGDGIYMPCPNSLLPLADACAENDARAVLRLIWPHLLEASLAGVEPFTLEAAS